MKKPLAPSKHSEPPYKLTTDLNILLNIPITLRTIKDRVNVHKHRTLEPTTGHSWPTYHKPYSGLWGSKRAICPIRPAYP